MHGLYSEFFCLFPFHSLIILHLVSFNHLYLLTRTQTSLNDEDSLWFYHMLVHYSSSSYCLLSLSLNFHFLVLFLLWGALSIVAPYTLFLYISIRPPLCPLSENNLNLPYLAFSFWRHSILSFLFYFPNKWVLFLKTDPLLQEQPTVWCLPDVWHYNSY